MVSAIFASITQAVTAFIGTLSSGITAMVALFYDGTTGLTVVGTLATIVVAVSLCYFLLRFIMGLIRLRG